MKTLYLLEAYPESFEPAPGTIISLTPEVSYKLRKQTISFSIPEDYFPLENLNSLESSYKKIFKEWIDYFDGVIFKHFDYLHSLKVRAARLYGYYLKLLIDPFVVKIFLLRAIFEKENPEKVVFVSYDSKEQPVDFQLVIKGCSVISLLIPLFCRRYDAELNSVLVTPHGAENSKKILAIKSSLKSKIKGGLLNLYTLFNNLSPKRINAPAVFCLSSGWTNELIDMACNHNYRIFYRKNEFLLNTYYEEKILKTDLDYGLYLFEEFAGFEFAYLLRERMRYVTDVICPALENAIRHYRDYFEKKNVKYVIASNNSKFDQFSIMAAAYSDISVVAVMMTHGYSIFDCPMHWLLTEHACNLYLTFSDELKDYFSNVVFRNGNTDIAVETSALWLNRYKQKHEVINRKTKPVVLYIPTMFMEGGERLDGATYTDTWYFRHQEKLLRYFASEKNYQFIWKSLKTGEKIWDSAEYLKNDMSEDNVTFTGGRLTNFFQLADFAILDYPSTPFLETVMAGIPTLALYHESLRIRDSALEFWGNITKPFATTEHAIEMISSFLRDDPSKYLKKIPINDNDPFEILERYARTVGSNKRN